VSTTSPSADSQSKDHEEDERAKVEADTDSDEKVQQHKKTDHSKGTSESKDGKNSDADEVGTSTTEMKLSAKIVDSVLVIGGIGVAGAVAGGVAAEKFHEKEEAKKLLHTTTSFLKRESTSMVHTTTINAIEMYPSAKSIHGKHSGIAKVQPDGIIGRMDEANFTMPDPIWLVVIVLGIIGSTMLLTGAVQIVCCGGRKRDTASRTCSRSESEEALQDPDWTEVERTAQSTRSSEESADSDMPLLRPLPPLLPQPCIQVPVMQAPVPTVPSMRLGAGSFPGQVAPFPGSFPQVRS